MSAPVLPSQVEMMFAAPQILDSSAAYLVATLQDRDWLTAKQIKDLVYLRTKEIWGERLIRELASESLGEVCGGQKGYKLTRNMTHEEYNHWRNWMTSQATQMRNRVIEGDRVFYSRKRI